VIYEKCFAFDFLNKNGSSGFGVDKPKESKAAEGGC